MTKDLKIYFSPSEEDLSDWFKKTYREKRSRIIKEHLKNLRSLHTAPEKSADELLKLHFADVGTNDKLWIAKMRKEVSQTELKLEIENRLNFAKKLHPKVFSELFSEFEKNYPNLYKLVKK